MHRIKIPQSGFLFISFVTLSLLLATGCTDDIASSTGEETFLRFQCDSVETRAAGYAQSGDNAITSMGIYASHTSNNWTPSAPINFMTNQEVTRQDASSPWTYTPEVLWPGSGYTTFFAYAPYEAKHLVVSGNSDVPQMKFSVDNNVAQQIDLLVANPNKDLTRASAQGYVNMLLRHALTRISFAARVDVEGVAGTLPTIQITNINLTGIYNQGTTTMNGKDRQWTPEANAKGNYTLKSTADPDHPDYQPELDATTLEEEYLDITTREGYLFLLPQQVPDDASIVITYSRDGADSGSPITLDLAKALSTWQSGEAIRFLIAIKYQGTAKPVDAELKATYTAWSNVNTDVTIDSDPYLDVTDLNVSSYDAAATRVYFYTNQPASSVYIDPSGTIAASGYPAVIKTTFCNLAKGDALSMDGTTNFHFDETTHKGYFDIINYDTGTAGSGTNKGRQAIKIKLRAGKLMRDITVQPVVTTEASRKDETRYIGTFHRYNERGERIVTWYADPDTEWTATIEEKPAPNTSGTSDKDYKELCIDRQASPDYQSNSLYSYSPREAEGAIVDPNTTTVSGKGRVYFRVGWKSTLTNTTATRHARIKVTYKNGAADDYIYCRQGEEPEGLTLGNTGDPFSVYNLMSDGIQVDYPTQGGLLSQWGRPVAWPPIDGINTTNYPKDVDKTLSLDVNICPVTYAYPNQETIDALKGSLSNLSTNWGYYADGYFDRRAINTYRVNYNSTDIAAAGVMLYVPDMLRSVFMPTVGYREGGTTEAGILKGKGTESGYWSEVNGTNTDNAGGMIVRSTGTLAEVGEYDKRKSYFMRCIKILNPVTLYFDANGGENAPRPISVTKATDAKIHIPKSIVPDNYRMDGYEFKSWNTKIDGSGAEYAVDEYYPKGTDVLEKDVTLYAQWGIADINVDYAALGVSAANLITNGVDKYASYTITDTNYTTNNGNTISSESSEPVYPNLVFGEINDTKTWVEAYKICKDKGSEWRLPRVSELYWIHTKSKDLDSKLFGTSTMWSGSIANTSNAWIHWYDYGSDQGINNLFSMTSKFNFRCVHAKQ